MVKPKKITIFKSAQFTATYSIGDEILYKDEKSGKRVTDITVGFFRKVTIDLSDGSRIIFKGMAIEYEI